MAVVITSGASGMGQATGNPRTQAHHHPALAARKFRSAQLNDCDVWYWLGLTVGRPVAASVDQYVSEARGTNGKPHGRG